MCPNTFAGKFLSRLERIDRQQIESYLLNLIQAREFLEVIFNRMLEGIIVTDLEFRILFMNTAACKNLELKGEPNQFAGKQLPDLIKSPRLRERIQNFNPHKGEDFSEELKIKHPKGRILEVRLLPILDQKDHAESLVFLISDITEQKMKDYTRIQQQRITALAKLTAGVAHEIKNPLNSLNIHAQLLKKYLKTPGKSSDNSLRERSLKSIDIILEEVSRLSEIVNQFLTAVRPRRIILEQGDVNEIIRNLAETLAPTLEEKGMQLELALEPIKTEVRLNKQNLYQAFWNIAKNAEEAMEKTENPRLRIVTQIKGQNFLIDFTDNGCGIPEEHFDKIFDPYFTTKFSGSGRGLMIAYTIINEHGGTLDIESRKGEGTNVRISLPLARRPVRLLTERTTNHET